MRVFFARVPGVSLAHSLCSLCMTRASADDPGQRWLAIEPLDAGALDEVADCVAEVFTTMEPLAVCLGVPRVDFKRFALDALHDAVRSNLSLVARREGRVVGFRISHGREAPDRVPQVAPSLGPVVAYLSAMQQKAAEPLAAIDDLHHDNTVRWYLLGVRREVQGRGVAKALYHRALRLSLQQGYRYAVSEPTNPKSASLLQSHGFLELVRDRPSEFTHAGRRPFAEVLTPCRVMICDLEARGAAPSKTGRQLPSP